MHIAILISEQCILSAVNQPFSCRPTFPIWPPL